MRILYATDGSDSSTAAADLLVALGNRSAIDLIVLSVVDSEPLLPAGYFRESDVLREMRAPAKELVDQASAHRGAADFSVAGEVTEGRAGQAIVQAAERERRDLVVVGAGSHGWLGNLLLGSTSTHVLHGSDPQAAGTSHLSGRTGRPQPRP